MKKGMKKWLIKIATLLIVVALPVSLLAGCTTNTLDSNEDDVVEAVSNAYVSMKINPEIEFGIDENGNVDSVYCVNEDAETLLSDVNLVGLSYDMAAETIVDLATQAGYIDVDGNDNEVSIAVITEEDLEEFVEEDATEEETTEEETTEEEATEEETTEEETVDENQTEETENEEDICDGEQIKERIRDRINRYFDNHGIFGKVSEQTLEEYQEMAEELDLPLGQVKMLMRALELNPELTLDELKDLSPNVLMALCKDKQNKNKINAEVRQEYKNGCEEIKENYANIPVLCEEIEAIETQLENFEGTEEQKAELELQLENKKVEYNTQRDDMKEEIEANKEQYQEQRKEIIQEKVQEKQQKMQQNKGKYDEHMENFQNNREETSQRISNWRNGKK